MTAVGYLRKSKVSSDRHLSWEVQEAQIRELAARNGDVDLELLSDWGRSGRGEKTALRAGYRQLRERIESGAVDVVYAYSLSRLARSLSEYSALAELCRDRGVRIRLCKEGELDYASPSGRLIVNILASVAQMEAELAQERARDTVTARRARGDVVGSVGYGYRLEGGKVVDHPTEDLDRVLEAYRLAGSYHGAARLLNEWGVPTKFRSRLGSVPHWSQRAVSYIVGRSNGVVRRASGQGAKAVADARLFRLLRCSCGQTLTPKVTRTPGYPPYQSYTCYRARTRADHPRPASVAESKLLPWLQAEAARLTPPDAVAMAVVDDSAKRDELAERRRRVLDNYEDQLIDKAARDGKLAAIGDELERSEATSRLVDIPAVDWTWDPRQLNDVLRSLWAFVQLDEGMRPVCAEWTVPEWRSSANASDADRR